jgi:predicted DNA-binding transcriptional regulator AlpA
MDHELVLEPECRALTRLHASTRWRLERQGKFPRSFKIGDPDAPNGRKAWSRSEIMAWIAGRMAARPQRSRLASCSVTRNSARTSALSLS